MVATALNIMTYSVVTCLVLLLQFSFDITDVLDLSGDNELIVGVYDPTNEAGTFFLYLHQ